MQAVLSVDLQLLAALAVVHELVHLRRTKSESEKMIPFLGSGVLVQALQWAVLAVGFDDKVRRLVVVMVCAASAEVVQQVKCQLPIVLGVLNRLN